MTNYMSSLNHLTELYTFCKDISRFFPQNKVVFLPTYHDGGDLSIFKVRSTIFLGEDKRVIKLLSN